MENELTASITQTGKQIESILQKVRETSHASSPVRTAIFRRMQQTATINSHWHIAWPHWPPGIRAKVTAASQKIIRRLLQWYIDPIVEQQNQFNQTVVNALQLLADDLAALQTLCQSPSEVQQAKIDRLQRQINTLSRQIQDKD